jgi:hypothetical protein
MINLGGFDIFDIFFPKNRSAAICCSIQEEFIIRYFAKKGISLDFEFYEVLKRAGYKGAQSDSNQDNLLEINNQLFGADRDCLRIVRLSQSKNKVTIANVQEVLGKTPIL